MTCTHRAGDTSCSSHPDNIAARQYEYEQAAETKRRNDVREELSMKPDASNFEITEVQRIGAHLVLRVKYPNCAACSYEGNKVMVFLNVTEVQVLKWRTIDPHFREFKLDANTNATQAPSPAARFPSSAEGWVDACAYAESKTVRKPVMR